MPGDFRCAVHNTGTGVFSIASQNHGFTTAIAGGDQTLTIALMEAQGHLSDGAENANVVLGDEPLPSPFSEQHESKALAMGIVLSNQPDSAGSLAIMNLGRTGTTDPSALPREFPHHPSGPALRLTEMLCRQQAGECCLDCETSQPW